MDYREYIKGKKELYDVLLQFLECDNNDNSINFQHLLDIIGQQQILNNRKEIILVFHLLMQIVNNHHRTLCLVQKIEQIIEHFFKNMKNDFTNSEIFSLFKSNKLIILYLIKNQILFIDNEIANEILYRSQKTDSKYHLFFYPEIKKYLSIYELENTENQLFKDDPNILVKFDDKRQIGENVSYICELIRNDSIIEFVSYVNRTNLSLSSTKINPSIFETNSLLAKNSLSLIEYAAFYGSIQIFQYLKYNNVELTPSLWIYAIHGQNAELIHILEENFIQPPENKYNICVNESVKCHHNSFVNFFQDNYLNEEEIDIKIICQFYNFKQLPNEIENKSAFYYLCYYDYFEIINLYLNPKEKMIQERMEISYKKLPFNVINNFY